MMIAKKYNDTEASQANEPKKNVVNRVITGNLAEQGMNGVNKIVTFFSFSFSIVRAVIIPGTEQPEPTINGIIDLPDNPNFLNNRSRKKEIRDI